MTAVHENEQPDTYPWRAAPSHLKTRRQLRAAGLSPGGQDVAALMLGKRRGHRLIAHLYDIALARPKRVPSAAQLDAIAKATREHQARAAERHGYPRTDLTVEVDPGSQWDRNQPFRNHSQKDNDMSINAPSNDALDDWIQADLAAAATETAPVGHGQRLAYLHALVAVNQARDRRENYFVDMQAAEEHGQAAADTLAERIEVALERDEAALTQLPDNNRDAHAAALAKALTWKEASPAAADRVTEITTALRQQWGVLVDIDELSVGIDPEFDAHTAQVEAQARAVRVRELAAVDVVAGLALPEDVKAAVGEVMTAWSDQYFEPEDPQIYVDKEPYRYGELLTELGKVKMPDTDRAALEFTVDYLRNAVDVDLLDTPVQVDPGEEARGRAAKMLDYFARGQVQPGRMAEEISVMTAPDQDAMREVGRAITAGQPVETDIWPGYIDREHVSEELMFYAMDAGDLLRVSDYIVQEAASFAQEDPERLGVTDDTFLKIDRMATRREQLRAAAATGKGLTAAERHQITAVMADIDCGRIGHETQLPELMWVDERTKAEVDLLRSNRPAAQLSTATTKQVRELIADSGAVEHYSHQEQIIDHAVSRISDSVYSVAAGAPLGVEYERKEFTEKRRSLGEALDKAGVDRDTKLKIRNVIDGRAREAGQLGRGAAQRRTQWRTRTDAAISHRDDQAAQRRAVANSRAPRTNSRHRADRSAQPSSPAPARHSMRRTGPEVER
ncbi:RRQRL motif-containing zinc-binding protein [Nocardia aurea]|uniref:RRQRL motif-containing zinc-binding protein n=1 Tax=Nocardia aurea TaxID=2144174 RepID=A0ABV3G516_9NOCA